MAMRKSGGLERPGRLSREQRREHLLDVAAHLVVTDGVEALTMEGVAAAAGVSKGLGYFYFDNRNDLLLALLRREAQEHEQRVGEAIGGADGFDERIRAAAAAWFDTVTERGTLLGRLLQANQIRGPLEEGRRRYMRRMEDFFAKMATDEFGLAPDRAVAAAAIFLAGLNGVIERWATCGDPRELLEDTFVTLVMGGLRALGDS